MKEKTKEVCFSIRWLQGGGRWPPAKVNGFREEKKGKRIETQNKKNFRGGVQKNSSNMRTLKWEKKRRHLGGWRQNNRFAGGGTVCNIGCQKTGNRLQAPGKQEGSLEGKKVK